MKQTEKLRKVSEDSYFDEVGGFHSIDEGRNSNDIWCGECPSMSFMYCVGCKWKDNKEDVNANT